MTAYLLAIDQGTSNSRAILFSSEGVVVASHEMPLKQSYPEDGWVEQDATEMVENSITCLRQALAKAQIQPQQIAALGITNQRETTIIWDRISGQPIYPAIVWLDRRTADLCKQLAPLKAYIRENTGLLIDPYFSATKIAWILNHREDAREKAKRGELLFGTVDCYLLWRLTGNKVHATDVTNASRTMLFNIKTQQWDPKILDALNIPPQILPEVRDNTADFGSLHADVVGAPIAICGMAGDQQAATIGQACFQPGMVKSTYGTGCFMVLNTGAHLVHSRNQLLTTIIYRSGKHMAYGLEGSIFSAGITIKWLRDQLKIIEHAADTEELARTAKGGAYFVPAFTGLGAPYWDSSARAAILGITPATDRAEIVRAALESVAYQTRDLLTAMTIDSKERLTKLRVDGGMAANNWLLQFLSDMLDLKVERPTCIETTALGVAYLAGLQVGLYDSFESIAKLWRAEHCFKPQLPAAQCERLYLGWQDAVKRVL